MLGVDAAMTLNYTDHQAFGGLNQLGLGDLDDMDVQIGGGQSMGGVTGVGGEPLGINNVDNGRNRGPDTNGVLLPAQERVGVGAGGAGGGEGGMNVATGSGMLHNEGTVDPGAHSSPLGGHQQQQQQQQQQQPPAPPPPSSWAAKVRAGLGSDSPTVGGATGGAAAGMGSIGDMCLSANEMDPAVTTASLSFGHLSGGIGPRPGPIHGLSMEAGGMPSAGNVGRGGPLTLSSTMPLAGGSLSGNAISRPNGGGIGERSMGPVGTSLGIARERAGSIGHSDHGTLQQQQQPLQQQLQHRGIGAGSRADAGIAVDGVSTSGGMSGGGGSPGERRAALPQAFAGLDLGGGSSCSAAAPLSAPGSRSNSIGGAGAG
ncbi:unnamed protein product, partial [Sphacelaria rigidula]